MFFFFGACVCFLFWLAHMPPFLWQRQRSLLCQWWCRAESTWCGCISGLPFYVFCSNASRNTTFVFPLLFNPRCDFYFPSKSLLISPTYSDCCIYCLIYYTVSLFLSPATFPSLLRLPSLFVFISFLSLSSSILVRLVPVPALCGQSASSLLLLKGCLVKPTYVLISGCDGDLPSTDKQSPLKPGPCLLLIKFPGSTLYAPLSHSSILSTAGGAWMKR